MKLREKIKKELFEFSSEEKSNLAKRYFKVGNGGYAKNDIFIGVRNPEIRILVKKYFKEVDFNDVKYFLHSKIHEERALALLFLVEKFEKSRIFLEKEEIFNFYLEAGNIVHVNNWDLVDLSCYKIIGNFLYSFFNEKSNNEFKDKVAILYTLSKDSNLWLRRISIVSTLFFIKNGLFKDSIQIIKILLADKEDLIHKASGWMLREIGKKDKNLLISFLKENHKKMPRICLSYAKEKLTLEEWFGGFNI